MLNIKKTLILSLLATLPMQVTATSNPAMVPIISYLLSDSSTTPHVDGTANAGSNQTVDLNSLIRLDGSSSTNSTTYSWSFTSRPQGSLATLSNANTSNPTFTADQDGIYTLKLIVNGGDSDTVSITSVANEAPIANAGSNKSVETNQNITITGSGSDSDGHITDYLWKQGTNTLSTLSSFTHSFSNAGTYTLTLRVTDNDGASHSDSIDIIVSENSNPSLSTLLPVMKTGQTKQYASYDDGHYQIGTQRTLTRRTHTSGDYVEDSGTNLMWQDTPMQAWVIEGWTNNLPDISDENQVSQASANSYCQSATTGGYSDWRLPTVHELRTIVNYSVYSHANYRNEFKNLSGWTYLTASKYQQTFYKNLIKHRGIFGCDGRNVLYDADDVYEDGEKIISGVKVGDGAYVRCTRGTTLKTDHNDGRFVRSSSDKTLTDTYTNLEWQDYYEGGFDDDGYAVDGSANKGWANSFGYCENLTLDGRSDWRVPNYNEQFSLIEEDQDIQWNIFNQGKRYSIYWSSTTYEKNNYAWSYSPSMRTFYFAKKDRIKNTAVRCIRGGE